MFATAEDLATLLREDVDTAAAEQALELATGRIISDTLQTFTVVTGDVVVLPGDVRVLRLPQRPVTAVTLVETAPYVGGSWAGAALNTQYTVLNYKLEWVGYGGLWPPRVRVTYTHGYATIPQDVKACALALAVETYDNPTGNSSETVDDYTYRRNDPGDTAEAQLARLIRRYRPRVASVRLGAPHPVRR